MADRFESPGTALSQQMADEKRLGKELVVAAENMLNQVRSMVTHGQLMPAVARAIWTNEVTAAIERIGIDPASLEGQFLLQGIDEGLGDDAYDIALEARRNALSQTDLEDTLAQVLSLDAPSLLASAVDIPTEGSSWLQRVRQAVRASVTGLAGFVAQRVLQTRKPTMKQWVTRRDDKVRDTHAAADGQTVPINSPFMVGGFPLMYPGDRTGPIGETINCRCVMVGVNA